MKKIAIYGLGKSGLAAYDFFKHKNIEILASDDDASKAITKTAYKNWDWKNIDFLILSPGIPLNHPICKYPKKILGDIELLYQANPQAKYIAITGTNGKSTTTALIYHILKSAGKNAVIGGNFGNAALALPSLDADGIYVLEMSSYQLDLLQNMYFDIAVLLNITPDHLLHHRGMTNYISAKCKIFTNSAYNIIAVDDDCCKNIAKNIVCEKISADNVEIVQNPSLQGRHNRQNIAIAKAVCQRIGIKNTMINKAIDSFEGLAHRLEFIAKINNITYVNDSKATNAEATQSAINVYKNIFWIAGGVAKEGGIESLDFSNIHKSYLIGESAKIFAETLKNNDIQCRIFKNLAEAFIAAKNDAENAGEGTILFSPASASFDMWKNFEERGYEFKGLVDNL